GRVGDAMAGCGCRLLHVGERSVAHDEGAAALQPIGAICRPGGQDQGHGRRRVERQEPAIRKLGDTVPTRTRRIAWHHRLPERNATGAATMMPLRSRMLDLLCLLAVVDCMSEWDHAPAGDRWM